MRRRLALCMGLALACSAPAADDAAIRAEFGTWEIQALGNGGRIDAICELGQGAVVCATRKPDPGRIFLSTDYGVQWREIASPTLNAITCIAARDPQAFCIATDHAEVFGTTGCGTQIRLASPNHNRVWENRSQRIKAESTLAAWYSRQSVIYSRIQDIVQLVAALPADRPSAG